MLELGLAEPRHHARVAAREVHGVEVVAAAEPGLAAGDGRVVEHLVGGLERGRCPRRRRRDERRGARQRESQREALHLLPALRRVRRVAGASAANVLCASPASAGLILARDPTSDLSRTACGKPQDDPLPLSTDARRAADAPCALPLRRAARRRASSVSKAAGGPRSATASNTVFALVLRARESMGRLKAVWCC